MSIYDDLQAQHRKLLEQREAGIPTEELVAAVNAYIRLVRSEAHRISSPRDRDQLRANLRFWASFLYDQTGTYPDTSLPPAAAGRIALAGPARWLFWGTAVLVLVALLVILSFALKELTDRIQASLPATAINELVTQIQAEQTQVAASSTLEADVSSTPPPSATPTPLPSPRATITPNLALTVYVRLTQAAKTEAAATATAARQNFYPTISGEKPRLALLPTVSVVSSTLGCAERSIRVSFSLTETASIQSETRFLEAAKTITAQEFHVSITPAGGGRSLVTASRPEREGQLLYQLANSASTASTFLVHVEHPVLLVGDVIVQFPDDCSQNQIEISYTWGVVSSLLEAVPFSTSDLSLGWELLTWGPSPQVQQNAPSPAWVALLNLKASGGDQRYFYWNYNFSSGGFDPLTESQITLSGFAPCEPARALVGVTSAGAVVTREILLFSPLCIQQPALP